jgi:alkylhydroperoxidase family enzyme
MTNDSLDVSSELFSQMREHFDEGEIVELAVMAGMFNYLNRVSNALEVEPTKPGEGLE